MPLSGRSHQEDELVRSMALTTKWYQFLCDSSHVYNCSVAAVHVTRILSVDWMVQPNHGQRSIFKSSHSQKQYTYIGIHRWMDRLTGNYDVTYRACTMTDREGQTVQISQ